MEGEILSELQSSPSSADIHTKFFSFLQPLILIRNNSNTPSPDTLRTLAKQFINFLNKSLSLLPKRLSNADGANIPEQTLLRLFDVYRLCLDCLDLVSSQCSCKPYSVHIQRARYLHCLAQRDFSLQAQAEAYSLLHTLRVLYPPNPRLLKGNHRYLPMLNHKTVDQDLALLIWEILLILLKCASQNQTKDEDDYRKLLLLIHEARPWLSVLDPDAGERMQRPLAACLSRISYYLVTEYKCFSGELIHKFCTTTFREHERSYLKEHILKFAARICSYLLSQEDDQDSNIIDILKLVLDSMATECKVGVGNVVVDFLELVSYCANKCRYRSDNVSIVLIDHLRYLSSNLREVKGEFREVLAVTSSVMAIYAAGLSVAALFGTSTGCKSFPLEEDEGRSAWSAFLEKEDIFVMLNDSLSCLKCYLNTWKGENLSTDGDSFLMPCLEALRFLCQPLAEFICSKKKVVLDEKDGSPVPPVLDIIQNSFSQFCSIFLQHRSATEKGNDVGKTIVSVAVACITLSCRTKHGLKASLSLMERIISASWTQVNGLKYIFASLHNTAITLFRTKRMLEASGVLEIACRASWTGVIIICQVLVERGSSCEDGLSGDAAADLCNEACAKTAFLLDLLCEEPHIELSHFEVERVVKDCLESWSIAKTLWEELPSPVALVRQWVKIQSGRLKNEAVCERAVILYSLLSSSAMISERILGILMEQELVAYKEATSQNPRMCQKMRTEIMKILLDEFYDSKDRPIEKSRILIGRGCEIRVSGGEVTEECLQCLSEAIATLSGIPVDKFSCEANGLLAYAYCLRECWVQIQVETEQMTKQRFQDLHTGVDLCLRPRCCHVAESCQMMSGDLLNMLYQMLDLLSIKGFTDLHIDIYKIMIQLFGWKKVPVGKLLVVLWKSRRLSHPLCPFPIDPKFITEACKNHDELNKLRYWIKCMEESQPLLLGFEQCFFPMLAVSSPSSYNHASAITSDLTEEKITQVASSLLSSVPVSSESIFVAAFLYYDLSERLIQSGQIVEALVYAKEARCLRTTLLQEMFVYSVEQQEEICDATGDHIQKFAYKVKNFDLRDSVATETWFCSGMPCDIEAFVLTPWNVLQCYLQSTLQEGTIHEILGNQSEAETLLWWGKSISCFKSLPMFVISFSSLLGKLYRKRHLWNLADIELKLAREVLTQKYGTMSCLWCKSVLEITISEQLGDLHRNRCCNGAEGPSFESLSSAIDIYRSVLINLNSDQIRSTVHCPFLASTEMIKDNCDNLPSGQSKIADVFSSKSCTVKTEKVSTRQSRAKNEKKPLKKEEVRNVRMTRSRHHNLQKNNETLQRDMSTNLAIGSNNVDLPSSSQNQSRPDLETKCLVAAADILLELSHLFDKIKCLHCLLLDLHSSSSLSKFICMRWELARRRLLLRSLVSIAKCLRVRGNIHEAREALLQSSLLLINRNTCSQYSSCPASTLFDLIGEGYPRNIFTIEGASLLYHICWMSLKKCPCNNTSQLCSELSSIEQLRIISWLRMVFILCHEVPIISQKVSRMLAALYIINSSAEPFALPFKGLSVSHWASFFHQAAIGTHHNQELSSRINPNGKRKGSNGNKNCNVCSSIASVLGKAKQSSVAPLTEKEFHQVVLSFFQNLPSVRVICISYIGGADGELLRELLYHPSSVQAWLLLCRLNSDNHPISMLLPASSLAKEYSYDGNASPSVKKSALKKWRCPWVSSLIDDVAPAFKLILEENFVSSSVQLDGNTRRSKLAWWAKRKELDERLGDFLHNMEQSWLGPFKYLLSEEWPELVDLNSLQKNVLDELGYDDDGDDCQRISKSSPGNARYSLDKDDCVLQIILNGGCYVHKSSNTSTEVESLFGSFLKTLPTTNELVEFRSLRTKPVMLVLDSEVQMLPWESLPVLKSQEVYRMPSLYSISITLDRCYEPREKDVRAPEIFPWIDPLDSYYVLNPGGDLGETQITFENWFNDQHFEGMVGTAPTIEEVIKALRSHDLFLYFGHGSGSQYFPGHQIKKLDRCSGTVLMGCSSGSLKINGTYPPQGAPLCYLLGGSPVVVANLWEVTDKDIDRFGKAMLDAWLEERSNVSKDIDECDVITNQLKSVSIRSRGDRRKQREESVSEESGGNNRPKVGSFIGQARQACKLPFLIGASPVCYGVPTGITKKIHPTGSFKYGTVDTYDTPILKKSEP